MEDKIKQEIIDIVFAEELATPEELETQYPARNLSGGAMVTRIAPSPTGFMHIGSLYSALISERFAHQSSGVFFVRIEDTDKKREVEGAVELISQSLKSFGIDYDEGRNENDEEVGQYGPYTQSHRSEIYKTFVKEFLQRDLAYLCFATSEELDEMRSIQQSQSVKPGYYGEWAKWRTKSSEEVLEMLKSGKAYVVRFKSPGDYAHRIKIHDEILGTRELPENDQDIVIMKSDKLPTYHFAHLIDDHLMRTTHVIRGDEWFPSLPIHVQLFESMGWEAPKFAHIAPIQKLEESSKRKLSKRKDPEANIAFFDEKGYPKEAIKEYLLNLANSNFEDWRKQNPEKDYREFQMSFEKLSNSSGALFDFNKLNDISKEVVSRMSAEEVYENVSTWAEHHNTEFANLLKQHSDYAKEIFTIERGVGDKSRKDIKMWSEVQSDIEYFFDDSFSLTKSETLEQLPNASADELSDIVKSFMESYNFDDSKEEWFAKVKVIAEAHGYSINSKEYKKNPESFKGNVADVAKIFRILLCNRTQTPDLHSIMKVMGQDRVFKRLSLIV